MKFGSSNSIWSGLNKFYSKLLQITFYISSFFVFFLFLFYVLRIEISFQDFLVFCSLIGFVAYAISDNAKFRLLKKIIEILAKIIAALGSIFLVVIFTNYFLEVSESINSIYLVMVSDLENILNEFVFRSIFIIGIISIYFYFIGTSLRYFFNEVETPVSFARKIIFIFLILTIPFIILAPGLDFVSSITYDKFGWIFSFSLVFLHINFWVKGVQKIISFSENSR